LAARISTFNLVLDLLVFGFQRPLLRAILLLSTFSKYVKFHPNPDATVCLDSFRDKPPCLVLILTGTLPDRRKIAPCPTHGWDLFQGRLKSKRLPSVLFNSYLQSIVQRDVPAPRPVFLFFLNCVMVLFVFYGHLFHKVLRPYLVLLEFPTPFWGYRLF